MWPFFLSDRVDQGGERFKNKWFNRVSSLNGLTAQAGKTVQAAGTALWIATGLKSLLRGERGVLNFN